MAVTEERIIGFDEDVEPGSGFVQLDEGLYEFTYCGYTQGNTQPRDGGQSFPTAVVKLQAKNVFTGEESETSETFIMTTKWQWKMAQLWKSLSCEEYQRADGTKRVKSGWTSAVGRRGFFEVTKTAPKDGRKHDDGTPVMYTNKNFIEPAKAAEVTEKWRKKFGQNSGQPVQQPQPAQASWNAGGVKW